MEEKKTADRGNWPKMQRGRQTEPVRKEKPKSQGPPHSGQHRHVCGRPRNQIEAFQLPNSQNRHIFAKFMIWQSSCIFHTISLRISIHLVQRADCHFPLETHTLHWPYVLCQTDTLSSTFSERVSRCMGLLSFCWFSPVCAVCAQRVTLLDNRQTKPLPSLVKSSIWFCHCHLSKYMACHWTRTLCLPGFPGVYAANAPEMFSYASFFKFLFYIGLTQPIRLC